MDPLEKTAYQTLQIDLIKQMRDLVREAGVGNQSLLTSDFRAIKDKLADLLERNKEITERLTA